MKKLAELFQQRLGMSEELSTKAAALAFDFMKEQLPDSIAPHLDTVLAADDLGDIVSGALGGKGLGGLFGGDD
jgi:hypothetical protein